MIKLTSSIIISAIRISNKGRYFNQIRSVMMAKQVTDEQKYTAVRLPKEVKPTHYDLTFKPDLEKFTFAGDAKIHYITSEPPKSIVLNVCELQITEGSIVDEGATANPLVSVTYSPRSETATLEFQNAIAPKGTVRLNFTGFLNDKMKGFYRTAIKIDDQVIYAATTQFESTDARRCFPCWDEPAAKSTFSVTIIHPKWTSGGGKKYEQVALSNMPEVSKTCTDDIVEVKFDRSPIMSTYLLALIIGPFESIQSSGMQPLVRVFTTPGKKELGQFALEAACKSVPYYEDYFGIKYPLPKMDLVAIPDFLNGAMENWGLITYRETALLVDPKNTATLAKQYIALVVAHEIAHQWFGNLVTMEWWTHLWLNEGFATFMEYLCVDHIFPEYDIWSQFTTDCLMSALGLDSLHNSHPIEVPVGHPSEIDEIFDAISYEKGASVIRMLYNFIGDDNFRKGMKDYLTKFAYKNAATEDLWDSLAAASNKPVRRLMAGWTSQKGFPWLSVGYEKAGEDMKLEFTQSKFTADGVVPEEEKDVTWIIPISAITGQNPAQAREICSLESRSSQVTVEGVGDSWVKLNSGFVGLYRTAYPSELSRRLLPAIKDQTLPPMDRLGLQSDFYSLCQAGKLSSVELLSLLQEFQGETNYTVWNSIDKSIGHLNLLLASTDFLGQFHVFCRKLYGDIFKRVGWDAKQDEKHTDVFTRSLVINRLITCNEQSVVDEAKRRFRAHVDKSVEIPADLRGVCYKAASMYGDEADFESLMQIHRTSSLQEEKNRVARVLGFTKDAARLEKVIQFGLSDEMRDQDRMFVIMPIGISNPARAWKIFKDNKDLFHQKYQTNAMMQRMIKFTTENLTREEDAAEVAKFFEEFNIDGAKRTVQQSVETIRLNASWLQRDTENMRQFLAK